jgi:cytochrome P450
MSLFSIFRDERLFREPVRFWPERWVQGTLPEDEYTMCRKAFTPFLIGPRNCAGSHVAIMMASIAYTHVLVNYDFRLGDIPSQTPANLWFNTPDATGSESEVQFESHYSIAGWEKGPFIQFKARG